MSATVKEGLLFDRYRGIGQLPFTHKPLYGEEYFNDYAAMSRSPFGVALNSLRVGLVSRYLEKHERLIDIGVGDGAFIRARGHGTYGYDINPLAIDMLTQSGQWFDVKRITMIPAASFWDSLEHIEQPEEIVKKIATYCFVSLPVFRDEQHVLQSKHYKPNEHYWYFTRHGLIALFWELGFRCDEMNSMETALGREDIGTFVFSRR